MLQLPPERNVQLPLVLGIVFIALGFFFFESLGAFIGHYNDDIREWELQEIEAHPETLQGDAYPVYTAVQAANIGLLRIHFFHGHGYLMVLASFIFLLLIAMAPGVKPRLKGILISISMLAMLMYNIGWGLAGLLLPYMGVEESQNLSERLFFIPFGMTIFSMTGIIAFIYGVEAVRIIQSMRSGKPQ